MSAPKHRADVPVVTEPRVQPVPKHAGEYAIEDRTHERLGALAFTDRNAAALQEFMRDLTVGNPFYGAGR